MSTGSICAVHNCQNAAVISIAPSKTICPEQWLDKKKSEATENIMVCKMHYNWLMPNSLDEINTNSAELAIANNSAKNMDTSTQNILVIPNTLETYTFFENEPENTTAEPSTSSSLKRKNDQNLQDIFKNVINVVSVKKHYDEMKKRITMKSQAFCEKVSVHIYLQYPQLYKMCFEDLNLPSESELTRIFRRLTMSNEGFVAKQYLVQKVINMSVLERQCVMCLGVIEVRPHLYYDIKFDKLMGVLEIDGIQKPEIARFALVLILQGIFSEWKQFISLAFVAKKDIMSLPDVKNWILNSARHLIEAGYHVRGFILESTNGNIDYMTNKLMKKGRKDSRSTIKTMFLNDTSFLFKQFYYCFMTQHDGYRMMDGTIARRQHLIEYNKLREEKKLTSGPKISIKHFNEHKKCHEISMKDVKEVVNSEIANAMSSSVNLHQLPKYVASTAYLIEKMSKLFTALHSDSIDITYLMEMKVFLKELTPVKLTDDNVIVETSRDDWMDGLILTITSILLLHTDIKLTANFEAFPTKSFNLDYVRLFIRKTSKNCTALTCNQICTAFKRTQRACILKPIINPGYLKNGLHIADGLQKIDNIIRQNDSLNKKESISASDIINKSYSVSRFDYIMIKPKRKPSIVVIAGFILMKCQQRLHRHCKELDRYIRNIDDTTPIRKIIEDEGAQEYCVTPHDQFIDFIEMMEIKFRSFMSKPTFPTSNNKLIKGLLNYTLFVNFAMPCTCFPLLYARNLFLRLRLYNMLKYNNRLLNAGLNEKFYIKF